MFLVMAGLIATMAGLVGGAPATAVETRTPVTGLVRLPDGQTVYGDVAIYRLAGDPPNQYYEYYAEDYVQDGRYDIDLEPGTYKFRFQAWSAGNVTQWYAVAPASGVDEAHATPVVVAGTPRDLGTVTLPVRMVTIHAQDQAGNPLQYVEVEGSYAVDWDDPAYDEACDWSDYGGTNAAGNAVFPVPKNCELSFNGWADDDSYDNGHVTVPAGTASTTATMVLNRLSTISGTVTATTGGTLGFIRVAAFDDTGDFQGQTQTASDGTFKVPGLHAGSYTLRFIDRLDDFTTEYYNDKVDLATATYFSVPAYTDVTGKNVALAPVAPGSMADTDLTGVVKGTNGPLSAVRVTAYRNGIEKGSALTGRDGRYQFDSLTAGSYQLEYDRLSGMTSELPYSPQWYLNSRSSGSSTPVGVTPDAPGADRNVTMQQWGAITGTLTNDLGAPVDYPYFGVVDIDMQGYEPLVMESPAGTYKLAVPPGSYHISYNGWDSTGETSYIQEFWQDSNSIIGSTPVGVTSGVVKGGFNVQLTKLLQNKAAPKITGTALVGKTLTASTGRWNLMADNQYTIQWLRGSTPVATGASYKLTAADVGKTISVRVTAHHGDLTGTALSAATAKVKRGSATTLTATSPTSKKVKLVIAVTGTGLTNPGGTVTVKRGATVVKTGVAVVNGKVTITLKSQPAGRQKYVVSYSGTAAVIASTSPVRTVKVKS